MIEQTHHYQQTLQNEHSATAFFVFMIILVGFFTLAMLIVHIFYVLSLRKTLKMIPEQHHKYPIWFVWMFIIPFVGIVFSWIMLPFGIPAAMKSYFGEDAVGRKEVEGLFGVGLAQAICYLVAPYAALVLMIIYWCKMVSIRFEISRLRNNNAGQS